MEGGISLLRRHLKIEKGEIDEDAMTIWLSGCWFTNAMTLASENDCVEIESVNIMLPCPLCDFTKQRPGNYSVIVVQIRGLFDKVLAIGNVSRRYGIEYGIYVYPPLET
jgi:hypothetical protein